MSKSKNQTRITIGYIAMFILAIVIVGLSLSVWAEPFNSAKDTYRAVTSMASDTTKTLVVTED